MAVFSPAPPPPPFFGSMVSSWLSNVPDLEKQDPGELAQLLADPYENHILSGRDPVGNAVIQGNKVGLMSGLRTAFTGTKPLSVFCSQVSVAFNSFWVGAMISMATPHPPTVSPISNVITFVPPISLNIPGAESEPYPPYESFIHILGNELSSQVLNITGVYTGLVPATPSPIPTPVPWAVYTPG